MYHDTYLKRTYEEIIKLVEPNSRVLDLGCGDGELIDHLYREKNVYGLGIDIDTEEVLKCIKRGVTVIQDNIDNGLVHYKNFDYVIMSETLQAVKEPAKILQRVVTVGKQAIVAFPNFGYFGMRLSFLFKGRMPKSNILPFEWYNTPNIHILTIKDFRDYCRQNGIKILKQIFLGNNGKKLSIGLGAANFLAEEAIFLIQKDSSKIQDTSSK